MSNYLGFRPATSPDYYFVSYNSEDKDRVGKIASLMHSSGVNLWYDYGLEYGENWEPTIAEKIKDSQAVLLFFTKGILQKSNSYVQKEYKIATRFFNKKVYVIMLDEIGTEDIPVSMISWWIDINEKQCVLGYKLSDVARLVEEIADSFGIQSDSSKDVDPAETFMKCGELYMYTNPGYARESYRLAIEAYEGLDGEHLRPFLFRLALANANIGRAYIIEQRFDERKAAEHLEKAVAIYRDMPDEDSTAYEYQLAKTLLDLSQVYAHKGKDKHRKAVDYVIESIALLEKLYSNSENLYGADLARAHCLLADLYENEGRLENVIDELQKSIALYKLLGSCNEELTERYMQLCLCQIKVGRTDESYETAKRLAGVYAELCDDDAETYEPQLAHALWRLGDEYFRANCSEITTEFFEDALNIYKRLEQDDPGRYASCINILSMYFDDKRFLFKPKGDKKD